ncbi:hypothetical protein [Methylovirgula sp. HY1]|uniref:hypothetical protein n=1 Tax=Methylovirgula sp. HY1 TaxID=2822761 RepID=UPI001C5B5B92|nr:hypothetical protein [Methylovirgula sp. HY1]QXX74237.1 hypothetical protein MHY1_01047 [Methylovirgula sp. HY1]
MTQTAFGPGVLIVTRTDVANGTPINIGKANALSLDFKGSLKDLYGQEIYPLDQARGTVKVTGKATSALISGIAWNTVFFGQNFTSGGFQWNPGEQHAIPAATPWTVPVTNSATFDQDLGVIYVATGLPLTKVATGPTVGQYSESAGTYTFAAADTGLGVAITYTSTVTTGQQLIINNQLLGENPTFQLDYYTSRKGKAFVMRLYACTGEGITLAAKLEDFMMPELTFEASVNAADVLGILVFPEIS